MLELSGLPLIKERICKQVLTLVAYRQLGATLRTTV